MTESGIHPVHTMGPTRDLVVRLLAQERRQREMERKPPREMPSRAAGRVYRRWQAFGALSAADREVLKRRESLVSLPPSPSQSPWGMVK